MPGFVTKELFSHYSNHWVSMRKRLKQFLVGTQILGPRMLSFFAIVFGVYNQLGWRILFWLS